MTAPDDAKPSSRAIPEGAWWIQELRNEGWLPNNDNDNAQTHHGEENNADDDNNEADEALAAATADQPIPTNNNTANSRNPNDLDGFLQQSATTGAGPAQPSDNRSHVSALTGNSAPSQANASHASGAASVHSAHSAHSGATSVHSGVSGMAGSVHSASVAAADMASVLMELVPGLAGGEEKGEGAAAAAAAAGGGGRGGGGAAAGTADEGGAARQAGGGGDADDDGDASLASTVFDDDGYDPYYHPLGFDDDDDAIDQESAVEPTKKKSAQQRAQFESAEAIEEEDKWEERIWSAARAYWSHGRGRGKGDNGKGDGDDGDDDDGDDEGNGRDGGDNGDDDGSLDSESDDEWFDLEDEMDDANPSTPTLSLPVDPVAALGSTDAASTIAGSATVYTTRDDDVRTKHKVQAFRSILVDCLGAYVTVFHGRPGDTSASKRRRGKDDDDDDDDDNDLDRGKGGDEATAAAAAAVDISHLPVDISVNPYVPLSVVEGLISVVIQKRMDAVVVQRRKRNLQSSGPPPPPPRPEHTERRRKRMTQKALRALLSPEFNAFRRYSVGSVVTGNVQHQQQQRREGGAGAGEEAASQVLERQRMQGGAASGDGTVMDDDDAYSRATTRQRRRKGAIDFDSENRTDIEKILYGRMADDDNGGSGSSSEKNKDGTSGDHCKKKDVTEEEEVRLRCGIGRHFLSGEGSSIRNSYRGTVWEEVFAESVLQRDILQLSSGDGETSAMNRYDSQLSSLAPKDLEVNLPEAYAVRYLPLFLRRATVASTVSVGSTRSAKGRGSGREQHEVLSDPRFFQARVNVLGPYYATMFHLADWESYNILSQSALVSADSQSEAKTIDENFHKIVSGALVAGMDALLDRVDGERVASIVGTGADEVSRRRRGKASEAKRNRRRPYDAMVMSFCLEVGRSLHHLGVRLGRSQQEYDEGAVIDQDEISHRDAASIEVSNYINSLKAYRSALEMLKAGESSARKSRFTQDGGSRIDSSPSGKTKARKLWEQDRDRQIFFFRDTMVSVDLYLADSLTCLGYCHDVKQKDFDRALMAYRESLSLYTKHVGKHHIVVCNTLHNLGTIHVEMQNWREALRCYNECVRITKKNKAKLAAAAAESGVVPPEQCVDDDLTNSLRCLGKVLTELKRWNDAERCFQDALAECHCDKESCACGATTLRTDLHSTMGNMFIQKSAELAARWHGHSEVTILAQTGAPVHFESPFTNAGSDMLVSDRALAEKNARDCFQEAVTNRRRVLLNMARGDGFADSASDSSIQSAASPSPASPDTALSKDFLVGLAKGGFAVEALSVLAPLFQDLIALGRLSFRQKAYDEAIADYEEARRVYDVFLTDNSSALPNDFTAIPLLALLGNTYARMCRFEDARECLGAAAEVLKRQNRGQRSLSTAEGNRGDGTTTGTVSDHNIGEKMEWASIHYRMGLVAAGGSDHAKAIVSFQECVKLMEEAADEIRPKDSKEINAGSDSQANEGNDEEGGSEKMSSADKSKTSEEKKSEDTTYDDPSSSVDPKVAIAVNIALATSYWAMGKSCDEVMKAKDAQKCYKNGMQYYNAVKAAESKMPSFEAMKARWFHLFAEPSSLTPWGGTSSILLNLELGDVSERLARIKIREKDNAAAIESFDMGLRVYSGLSAHGYSVYSLRDEEFDATSFSGVVMDQKLKYCCEQLLSLVPDRPDVMLEMANMHLKGLDYENAIEYYKKAEEAAAADTNEDKTPKHPLQIANIKRRIGSTYKNMLVQSSDKLGKVDTDAKNNAIKYLDEAIKLFRGGSSSATTDNAIADASVALAEVYLLVFDKELPGNSAESSDDTSATPVLTLGTKSLLDIATDHLERALNFRKKRRGDLDAEVASTLHLIGIVHLKKGPEHIDDAFAALKAAFDTRKDLLSPNHIDLGETIGLLGKAHLSRRKGDDLSHALGAFTEALRIQEHARDALSEDDDSSDLCWKVASSESSIGECHFLQGDMPAAREAFQRSFADLLLLEETFSVDQKSGNVPISMRMNLQLKLADVLCNIARINVKNEELDEALTVYNSSLQNLQQSLALARGYEDGDDNDDDEETPSTSKAVHAIIIEEAAIKIEVAAVYEKKGRPEKSIELYQWCSKVFRNNEKEPSPSLVLSLRRLGQALLRQEKFDEAVTSLEEALESQKSINEKKAKTNATLPGDQRVMNLNVGLLHFELAQGLSNIDDKKGALTHYRNAVSLLDELALQPWDLVSTDEREPVTETQKSLNRKLLQCYDQMKHLTPGTMTEEEEEDELYDIFHRIANLRAAFGEHETARDLYLAVVSHQREMQGDNSLAVADLLFNLGTVYSCLEDMENAFDCHEECQLISEAIIGKDSPQLAENMLALGNISMSQEEFDDALHWFSSAERIMRQKEDGLSKADESTVATLVFKKGKCLQALGHGDNATQCFKTALDLFKRTEDLERVEVSDMMNALGNTAKVEGDLDKAMILYRQSLHLRKTLGDELSVANTKNNIGAVFHARGDMAQAMKFFSESLESKTLLLGVDHPETARSLANVGQIFLDNNDYLKARRCFMEALRVLRSVLGVDSVEVAICLYNLGVALEEGDDFSNALKVYQEAIEIFSRNADDHITFGFALHNAGVIYSKRNKPKDAVQFLEGALDVKIASFGPDSDDTADTRYCLAGALHELGDLDEALEHYSDVLRVRVRHLGKDSIETANVLMGLGEIHKSQGELDEAISCLVEALRVKRINGADDEEISSLSITVGALFRGLEDLESALQYFTDALEAKTYKNAGKVHLDSSLCLSLMAGCLFDQGLFREALQRYQEALEIRLLSDDDDDEVKVGFLLEKIGTAQVNLGEHEGAIVALKEALAIKERGGIADDPTVEFEIGSVYHTMGKSNFALGDNQEALRCYNAAIKFFKASGDEYTPPETVGVALLDKADVYNKADELSTSMLVYKEILEAEYFSPDSWEFGQTLQRLGQSYVAEGLDEEALGVTEEAVEIFEQQIAEISDENLSLDKQKDIAAAFESFFELSMKTLGSIGPEAGEMCFRLGDAYVQMGNHEKALHWIKLGIKKQEQNLGPSDPTIATGYFNKGNCLLDLGKTAEAIAGLEDALDLAREAMGEDNEIVADTYFSLAYANQNNSDYRRALELYDMSRSICLDIYGQTTESMISTLAKMSECHKVVGNYDDCIDRSREALSLIPFDPADTASALMRADIFDNLASAYSGKGDPEEALHHLHQALCIRREVPRDMDENQVMIARELFEMVQIHAARGDDTKVHLLNDRAVILCEEYFAKMSTKKVEGRDKKGGVSLDSKTLTLGGDDDGGPEPKEEDSYLKRLLSTCKANAGDELLFFADTVLFYGKLLLRSGKLDDAMVCFEITQNAYVERSSPKSVSMGDVHHCRGIVYALKKDYKKSLASFMQALAIRANRLSTNHIDLEETIQFLGTIHSELGNAEKAIEYFKDAISKRESRLGKAKGIGDQEDEAETFLRLGRVHQDQKEYNAAKKAYEHARQIRLRTKGKNCSDYGEILFALGGLLLDMGRRELSLIRLHDALVAYENSNETFASEIADVHFTLGIAYYEQEQFFDAIDSYERCLMIRKEEGHGDHAAPCAQVLTNLGGCYFDMKDYEKAEFYHTEALHMMEKSLGQSHADVAYCWHSLGCVYLEDSKENKGVSCLSKALKIQRECLDKNHSDIGNTLYMLGRCLLNLRETDRAIKSLTEALKIQKAHFGDDFDVALTHKCLARAQAKRGGGRDEKAALSNYSEAIRIMMAVGIQDSSESSNDLMACFDGAMALVRKIFGSDAEQLASLLHRRGICEGIRRNFPQAIASYAESLTIYKKIYGDRHITIGNLLFNMGVCFNEGGEAEKAIKCLAKAHDLTCEKLEEDHSDIADIDFQMGTAYKLLEDYTASVKCYERSLLILKQISMADNPKIASIMQDVGDICYSCNDIEKAERCYRECLRVRMNLEGRETANVAKTLAKLGALLRTKRDYAEALRCFEDSLVVRVQLSGKETDEIASSYFDLGSVHDLLDADKKAIFCYSESIRMYVAMDAEPKLSVAKALSNKAAIVMSKEEDDQRAMHIYQRALDVRRACLGATASDRPAVDLADIIWGQASIYDRMGEHEQALSYYEKCLACYQESVGHESSQVARCIQSISDSFLRGGHYTQAHDAVVEALRLREAIPGVPDEDIADSMLTLGTILFAWREYENALPYLERACAALMRIRGKFHIGVGSSSYLLGAIYESMQDYEKAMSTLKDSLNARKRALGEDHIDVAKVLTLIGKVHNALGEPDSAVLCFEEALEIATKVYGYDSEEAAEYLLDLAAALVAEDETEKAKACVDDALRTFKVKQINNHVGVAKCSSIKAMIYEKNGKLDAAREWYMNSVKILDSLLPDVASKEFLDDVDLHDDYLELASTLFKFANVDDMLGDEREAINLYHRSIHLYRSLQGEDHLNVANVQYHMALMLGRHEQFEKAMGLLQDALRIRVKSLGKDHPEVATCLFAIGVAHDKNQEYEDAILTYQECMRIQKLEYGPESVEVATTLENYGIAKGNSNDLRGAVESWEEGLEIMMSLGYDETNQLIINLAGHREIALLLLGESKADESEGAK